MYICKYVFMWVNMYNGTNNPHRIGGVFMYICTIVQERLCSLKSSFLMYKCTYVHGGRWVLACFLGSGWGCFLWLI